MPGQGKVIGGQAGLNALRAFQAFAVGKPMDKEGRALLRAKYLEFYAAASNFFFARTFVSFHSKTFFSGIHDEPPAQAKDAVNNLAKKASQSAMRHIFFVSLAAFNTKFCRNVPSVTVKVGRRKSAKLKRLDSPNTSRCVLYVLCFFSVTRV